MTVHDPALVERAAQAVFMDTYVVGDQRINEDLWERTSEAMRVDHRQMVRAALDAITETHVVIELPTVAYKGPHDTDAKFFRQVADRLEENKFDVGGGNVRAAVSKLLRSAAAAAERGEES